jgi:hypothetical protein
VGGWVSISVQRPALPFFRDGENYRLNGPMGVFEMPAFAQALEMAKAIAAASFRGRDFDRGRERFGCAVPGWVGWSDFTSLRAADFA